jgi:hypothetical protein
MDGSITERGGWASVAAPLDVDCAMRGIAQRDTPIDSARRHFSRTGGAKSTPHSIHAANGTEGPAPLAHFGSSRRIAGESRRVWSPAMPSPRRMLRTMLCMTIVVLLPACMHPRPEEPDLDTLIAEVARPVTDLCTTLPEVCERACRDCPDVDACLQSNGQCAAFQSFLIDVRDGGLSPFVPGCHMKYQDQACSVNAAFFFDDHCVGDILYEWWNPACHPSMGDMVSIDCRKLCILMRRPGGTCEYIANVCPGNEQSGCCICDPPQAPPIEP